MYFFATPSDGPVVVELRPPFPVPAFTERLKTPGIALMDIGFEGRAENIWCSTRLQGRWPDGYISVRPATYNTMTLLRSILDSGLKRTFRQATTW